jgi:hypothetical protein
VSFTARRILKMNASEGWMAEGMWTWAITGTLLVVVLLLAIRELSKK